MCVWVYVCVCDLETSKRGGVGPVWALAPQEEEKVGGTLFAGERMGMYVIITKGLNKNTVLLIN